MPLILLYIQYSFNAQHVSAVNTTIFRSLRLIGFYFMGGIGFGVCWRSVSMWLWRCGVFMQSEALRASDCKLQVASCKLQVASCKNNTTNVVIEQNSRKLLMMDILMSETCWAHKKWNKIASENKLVFFLQLCPINLTKFSQRKHIKHAYLKKYKTTSY